MSKKSSARFRFTGAAVLLAALVFLLPAVKSGDSRLYMLAVLVPCVILLGGTVFARMFSLDRMLVSLSLWLCASGIAALAVSDPEAALAQAFRVGAGAAALLAGGILIRSLSPSWLTSGCAAFLGLLLLGGKLLAPSFSLPLNEAALALVLIAFVALLTRQGPLSALAAGLAALALLLVQGDGGSALIFGLTLLLLLFAADGRPVVVLPALAAVLLLFILFFPQGPSAAFSAQPSGLDALVSAGAVGAEELPAAIAALDPLPLFTRQAGHYGLLFSGLTAMLYLPFCLRGAAVAGVARTRFHAVLAMGVTLLIGLRALTGLLAAFGFLSMAGAELPFLTASLPDLCARLFLTGLLCGISGRCDADLAEDAHLAMLAK